MITIDLKQRIAVKETSSTLLLTDYWNILREEQWVAVREIGLRKVSSEAILRIPQPII
jgi:hypothetical protein